MLSSHCAADFTFLVILQNESPEDRFFFLLPVRITPGFSKMILDSHQCQLDHGILSEGHCLQEIVFC